MADTNSWGNQKNILKVKNYDLKTNIPQTLEEIDIRRVLGKIPRRMEHDPSLTGKNLRECVEKFEMARG
jgi:hypothetical protein